MVTMNRFGCPEIDVRINGHAARLEFDTGNMTGLSIAPRLSDEFVLPEVGRWTSLDSEGKVRGRYPIVSVDEFRALSRTWTDVRAYEMADDRLNGLVGPRYFSDGRFTYDHVNRWLAVSRSRLPPLPAAACLLDMVKVAEHHGMIVVRGAVGDRPVFIQIDTGKSRTCVSPQLAAELKFPSVPHGVRLDDLRIGRHSFSVRSAKLVGFGGISDGLPEPIHVGIGVDVLSQMVLTVDYRRELVAIAPANGALPQRALETAEGVENLTRE